MISKESLLYKHRTQSTYNNFRHLYDNWYTFNLDKHYEIKLQDVYNGLPQPAKLFIRQNYPISMLPKDFKQDDNIVMAAL